MSRSTKSPVNEVSERIKNRRKEVEKIKAEIEKLINAGVGPVKIPNSTKQQLQKQQLLQEPEQQQKELVETIPETICSRNDDNNANQLLSNAQRKVPVQKHETQKSPPQTASSKARPYDVAEAREYIKKQREKRVQQSKNQIHINRNQIDLKNQRLKALQDKQRELLAKNIQMKRERSKSRDRNSELRLDRTSRSTPQSTTRDKSRECPNVNLQKQPSEVVVGKPKQSQVAKRNCDQSNDVRSNNHINEGQDDVVCGRLSRSVVSKTDLNRPESLFKNISVRKKQLMINNNEDRNRVEAVNLENANLVDKRSIENIVTTEDCGRETKETQTSLKSNKKPPVPVPQLQTQYYPPDPYNTINTFIRKLQFTSNEGKKFADIGVQKSSRSSTVDKRQKIQDEIHELLNKNINNINDSIFNQQENLNLNLDSVEKLKLIPSTSIKNRTRNVSKRLVFDTDNSESDTSKNIPEISSESGVSSSRSTVINSETNLDLERLENLKLQTNNHEKLSSDIIAKSTKSYSSDFIDEIKSKSDNSVVEQQNNEPSSILNTSFCINESNDTIVDNLEKTMHLQVPPLNLDVNVNKTRGDSILSTQSSSRNETENKSVVSSQIPPTITIQTNPNNTTNRIHLKFEAEVHLLNDYNQTFHRFRELEEAFEHLKRESFDRIGTKKNNDTQTSFKTATTITDREQQLSINFSRGSDINDDNLSNKNNNKSVTTIPELELSNESANEFSINDGSRLKTFINTDYDANNCAGLSLNMFEQLIKDEDARLKHLKTIIKIREQALLDRTKGELVWLEIQKKQLVETGKIEQASLIKKKQRAVLLKLEQERNEIKRLKQTQKQASNERINKLKQQRNLIKSQLSTNDMLTNIKITTPASTTRKDRRHSGPLIVTQHRHKESTHSETSISTKRSGSGDDVLSITTTTSKVSEVSSKVEHDTDLLNLQDSPSNLHRNLSMREKALRERKRTAEELLKWHQKLLDEEKKITALELAANVLVKQIPNKNKKKKYNKEYLLINNNDIDSDNGKQEIFEFNGKQLNQLWRNMSGRLEKKFIDEKHYIMSQIEFEKFCKSATKLTKHANKKNLNKTSATLKTLNSTTTTTISELSDERDIPITSGKSIQIDINTKSISEDEIKTVNGEYSSQFESESVQEIANIDNNDDDVDKNQITSISELIQNFSKIEDEISVLGKHQNSPEESHQDASITEEIPIEPNIQNEKITNSENQEVIAEQLENNSNTLEKITNEPSIEISENVINSITDNMLKIGDSIKEIDEKFDESLKILSTDSKISRDNFEDSPVNSKGDSLETVQKEVSDLTIENTQSHDLLLEKSDEIVEKTVKTEDVLTENTSTAIDESTTLNQIVSNEILSEEIEKEESIETVKESEQYSDDFKSESKESSIIESRDEEVENDSQTITITDDSTKKTTSITTSQQIDVKKRVSEIMAEANTPLRSDRSPRLQDIYVTTYDNELLGASDDVKSEAEELLRKQIAIEQEIKQLEQQQKEQIPYLYMREIPNKPPPPYTPPSTLPVVQTILPTDPKQIDEITNYTSKVLYKAYELNNLENVKFSESSFKLISKLDIGKNCCELLFNICKELAYEHYKQFKIAENEPVWMKVLNKKQKLSLVKPYDCRTLERYMNRKLKELFNFEKPQIQESMIIKWGRKKRDHVDEILIKESQEEDTQWTNFDKDELIIKDQLTDFIMNMLIDETVDIVKRIFDKRNSINFNVLEEAKDEK